MQPFIGRIRRIPINQSAMAQLIFYYSTVDAIQKYGVHMKKQFEQQETWQTFTNMQ